MTFGWESTVTQWGHGPRAGTRGTWPRSAARDTDSGSLCCIAPRCRAVRYCVHMNKNWSWPPSARLADRIIQEQGHGGLLEWGLAQRATVIPPTWEEVAQRLRTATNGEIEVTGRVLRMWMIAAERSRNEEGGES